MGSMGMQIAGCALAFFGWMGVIIACAAPMWRVSAFIGSNIVTAQTLWEGLWMSCVFQSTGQMQCKVYDSMLALSPELQASRALTVVSIVVGIAGLLTGCASGKCMNCIPDKKAKARALVAAGVLLIISGLLCIIAVSWTASVIITNFYNPTLVDAQKKELGASLYVGWGAGALLMVGGGLLCANCPSEEDEDRAPSVKYLINRSAPSLRSYAETKTYI